PGCDQIADVERTQTSDLIVARFTNEAYCSAAWAIPCPRRARDFVAARGDGVECVRRTGVRRQCVKHGIYVSQAVRRRGLIDESQNSGKCRCAGRSSADTSQCLIAGPEAAGAARSG